MRLKPILVPVAALGLLVSLLPLAGGAGAQVDEGPVNAFPGFSTVDSYAQGQAATGFFFAVGNEETRLVGAQTVINGPPAGSENVAAFVQRGTVGQYVYDMAGGGGPGQAGGLPQPPPGEASAFFPADPPEYTWQGPITAGAKGPVVDGRFYAKATDIPTGVAEGEVSSLVVPGQLRIDRAVVKSHSEPTETGVFAESTTVLSGIEIGPLHIDTMVSHASGFVASAVEDPKAVATTVVHGATVSGSGVQLTDKGVVANDQTSPGPQAQVNAALAQAGLKNVSLLSSVVSTGEKKDSLKADAGGIKVVHQDAAFGNSNPQGFSGGGFSVGGAEVRLLAKRGSAVDSDNFGPPGEGTGEDPAIGGDPVPARNPAILTPRASRIR